MTNDTHLGPYELIKRIGYGGMAEIYLARTQGIGGFEKILALKVIHPKFAQDQEFVDMLIDEAKIAVQLNHVNICQIFDLGCIDGRFFIAMEFVDGRDLYQLLVEGADKDSLLPFELVAFIGREVAAGLHYAHTKADRYGRPLSLIHRDVSPQNVLVSLDGQVKLVDFGIAKATARRQQTESGVIKGKFYYMSPEQAWGDSLDHRSDVFSCGICLYEMVCGRMLYNEEEPLALLDTVRRAEIPSMRKDRPDIPEELERIIMKALARQREDRYQDAGALKADLSAFLYGRKPGFERSELGEYTQRLTGMSGFVLELPSNEPPETFQDFNEDDTFMRADEYDRTHGQSIIFALGKDLYPMEDAPSSTSSAGLDSTIEPDLAEHTSESSFDAWLETGEKTELIDVSHFDTSGEMASAGDLYASQDDSVTRLFDAPISPVGEPIESQSPPQKAIQETGGVSIETEEPETGEIHKPQPISRQEQLKSQDERPTIEGIPAALAQAIQPKVSEELQAPVARKKTNTQRRLPDLNFQRKLVRTKPSERTIQFIKTPRGISFLALITLVIYFLVQFGPVWFGPEIQSVSLALNSTPDGASIQIDGQDTLKVTPVELTELAIGRRYEIRFLLTGYDEHAETILIDGKPNSNGALMLKREIMLKRASGQLAILSEPRGSDVYINGSLKGQTPLTLKQLNRDDDKIFMVVKKRGFKSVQKTDFWGDRTSLKFNFILEPNNSR